MLPWMTLSRLLKSCAMPPVRRPTASIFWYCAIACCTRSRSMISFIRRSLAWASARVRSSMRDSSVSFRATSSWRLSCRLCAVRSRSASTSRAWYWRRRARRAEMLALRSVCALSGRSSRITLP